MSKETLLTKDILKTIYNTDKDNNLAIYINLKEYLKTVLNKKEP